MIREYIHKTVSAAGQTCSRCRVLKSFDRFRVDRNRATGREYICKDCKSKGGCKPRFPAGSIEKPCSTCREIKPLSAFVLNPQDALGRATICRECQKYARKFQRIFRRGEHLMAVELNRLCNKCKTLLPVDSFSMRIIALNQRDTICKDCKNKAHGEWYKRIVAEGLCVSCGKNPQVSKKSKRCRICADARYLDIRLAALAVYGSCCQCCGERNHRFLTFDHINNDGNVERKKHGATLQKQYRALVKAKRDDLQVLCFNCNCGRSLNNGICPHEAERQRLRVVGGDS